jgi:hypothetical protein
MTFQVQTQKAPLTKIKGQNLGGGGGTVGKAISGITSITNSVKTHYWFQSQKKRTNTYKQHCDLQPPSFL